MAADPIKIDSEKNPNLLPGYFTGNYTAINNRISNLPTKLSTAAVSFTNELQKLMQQNPMALRAAMQQPAQVQNVPNALPFTALVIQKIGVQGAILALSVGLRYCGFNKKMSPAPRFM